MLNALSINQPIHPSIYPITVCPWPPRALPDPHDRAIPPLLPPSIPSPARGFVRPSYHHNANSSISPLSSDCRVTRFGFSMSCSPSPSSSLSLLLVLAPLALERSVLSVVVLHA